MYVITSPNNIKKLMQELAANLQCGEKVEIRLSDVELISLIPAEALSNELSVIDAYEVGSKGAIIIIERRFGGKCKS